MVVASASIAVTAVVPSRIATPASILRRRCRRKLSISRRKNISVPSPFHQHSPNKTEKPKTESLKLFSNSLLILPFPILPLTLKDRSQLTQIRSLNHHLPTPYRRLQRNRIAPAFLPH